MDKEKVRYIGYGMVECLKAKFAIIISFRKMQKQRRTSI